MLTINLEFDANAQAAPQSFRDGVQAGADVLEAAIYDPITVNVTVGYGEYDLGGPDYTPLTDGYSLGGLTKNSIPVSYPLLTAALAGDETSAADVEAVNSLPTASSLNGQTNFYISGAEAKALGVLSATDPAIDGSVGFPTSFTGTHLTDLAVTELTHALGLLNGGGVETLVEYTSPGTHLLTAPGIYTSDVPAYFSIDDGNTNLADFDVSFDSTLFENQSGDPLNVPVTGSALTTLDLAMLSVLGFDTTAIPTLPTPSITPTATAAGTPVRVSAQNVSVAENTSVSALSLIKSVSAPSGDSIVEYGFFDKGGGSGYFSVNGIAEPDNQWIYALSTQLNTLKYVGGPGSGVDTIFVDAFDYTTNLYSASAQATATTIAPPGGQFYFTQPAGSVSLGINGGAGVAPGASAQPGVLNLEIFTGAGLTTLPALDSGFTQGLLAPGGGFGSNNLFAAASLTLFGGTYMVTDAKGGATVTLGSGNQTVVGAAGDTLIGGSGAQTLNAAIGSDSVVGGTGNYVVFGGTGDTIVGPASGATGTTTAQIIPGRNDTMVLPAAGTYTVAGSAGDTITAGIGPASVVVGGSGLSINLTGNAGNETFQVQGGNATVTAGAGNATVYAGAGDSITAGTGNDYVDGVTNAGKATINIGAAGNDLVLAGVGETVNGGAAALSLQFLGANVALNLGSQTGAFGPTVFGASGDSVTAAPGNFYTDGRAGKMLITDGSSGADLVFGSTVAGSPDTVLGGGASLNFSGITSGELVNLAGSSGNAVVNVFSLGATNDTVIASTGNDSVYTGSGSRVGVAGTSGNVITEVDGTGAGIGFGTNSTVTSAVTYGANPGAVTVGAGASTAKIVIGNATNPGVDFNTTLDTVFYAGRSKTVVDSGIIATATSTSGITTITLPDGTQMEFIGLASAAGLRFTS